MFLTFDVLTAREEWVGLIDREEHRSLFNGLLLAHASAEVTVSPSRLMTIETRYEAARRRAVAVDTRVNPLKGATVGHTRTLSCFGSGNSE